MKLIPALFLLIPVALWAQAPVNDDCSGLIDLGEMPYCSDPAQYTNVDATTSDIDPVNNIPACFNNAGDRDVWFQFTVPADGSIVDVSIAVYGNIGGNGTLQNPQVAVYRGDCVYGGLAELDCVAAIFGQNEVHLDLFGLTPGIPYFLRINDYSGTAAPNSGTFKLCVEEYIPDIIMGQSPGSQSCTGTLWDSGGPTGDYSNIEDLTFTICPQDFHQCIVLNVVDYNTESGFDYLYFYQGDNTSAPQVTQISGSGQNFEVQIPTNCATIEFISDFSAVGPGFQITWECSNEACTVPPITSCADPVGIPDLPYVQDGLSNCFSGNSIAFGPCDDPFLDGNDYVFSYTSGGDECIQINTTGTNFGAGVGVYDNCPTLPGANCIASAGGFFGVDPTIAAAFLENPGTYYIVFASEPDCSSFNISIDTVTCPVILPSASTCDAALNIGGCSNVLPEIIALNPGAGDPNFIQQGVNQGCFVAPQQNYSFFYFTAGADGKFGFTVQAANPVEASDIDYNVWGPINSVEEICNFVSNNQPVRSSWAAGADPTGLEDIHPVLGTPVLDEFDCGSPLTPGAAGDDFTRRLDVIEGKVYVILLDDFGNAIISGGIGIDFSGTTDGVLDAEQAAITVSNDTTICANQTVQLMATGGQVYQWAPGSSLSCTNCQNPIASPVESTTYHVQVASTCNQVTRSVTVKVFDLDLGPDVTVCNNAEFKLNPHPFEGAEYSWIGDNLSCYDCPTPTVSGLTTGVYAYYVTMVTPFCILQDTVNVTVVDGQAPQYIIAPNQSICEGATVALGGPQQPGTLYSWTSVPPVFTSSEANPQETLFSTTQFFLSASNASCPFSTLDSVLVVVFPAPILNLIASTSICQGDQIQLANTALQEGMQYEWTPNDGSLDDASIPNPLAQPQVTTTYTLHAFNEACSETQSLTIQVIPISISLATADSLRICQGVEVQMNVAVAPSNLTVQWSPGQGLQVAPDGLSASAVPLETITYTAHVTELGCERSVSVYIAVDSLPKDLSILPSDTTVCFGAEVLLVSPIYEPADYPGIAFQWSPITNFLTSDTLFNLVLQASETTVYQRINTFGACTDTSFATVNVIPVAEMSILPSDTSICPGKPVQLQLTYTPGVEEIMWSPGIGLSCTDCDNPVATPSSTTNYTVTGSFQGCSTNASATIQVLPPPGIQFPTDVQLCLGEAITLNSINEPGTNYSWTSIPVGFTSNEAQPTVVPTQSTQYIVQANNGCQLTKELNVSVFSASMELTPDTTICKNFSVVLRALGTLPGTYSWNTGQTGQTITVTPLSTTVYTVTYTYGDNCQITQSVTVAVQGEGVSFQFPNDKNICPGESVQLNNLAVPGATYVWTSNPAGFNSVSAIPIVSPLQTTTYQVTATLGICSTSSMVTISTSNPMLMVSNDTTICAGEPIHLMASVIGGNGGSFTWTPGGAGDEINESPTADTDYVVAYNFGDGCTITDTVSVTVVPSFMLALFSDPVDTIPIQLGQTLNLEGVVTTTGNTNGFTYTWVENGADVIGNQLNIETVVSTNENSIFYKLIVTSPIGCMKMDNITFKVVQPIVILPNAFTPDGDGNNDVFRLIVKEGVALIDVMQIYNRWGELVFESTETDASWDGRYKGEAAPSDVYIYIIRWRRGDGALQSVLKGDVTLIR